MSAGDLAAHFPLSKPAMSAHFAVLREADLIASEKVGKTVIYRLKLSVLEEAMLGFAEAMGFGGRTDGDASAKAAALAGERS